MSDQKCTKKTLKDLLNTIARQMDGQQVKIPINNAEKPGFQLQQR